MFLQTIIDVFFINLGLIDVTRWMKWPRSWWQHYKYRRFLLLLLLLLLFCSERSLKTETDWDSFW